MATPRFLVAAFAASLAFLASSAVAFAHGGAYQPPPPV
jgi:hypothetical protein